MAPTELWKKLVVLCANYRTGAVGYKRTVSINQQRECTSNCEAIWCPLHKDNTLKSE